VPNVVIDANTIASAALKADSVPERAVLFAIIHGSLYLSEPVVEEIREVLERPKFQKYITEERRTSVIALLLASAHFVTPLDKVTACRDPKDDKYLELALAAQASFIVTGDKDCCPFHLGGAFGW